MVWGEDVESMSMCMRKIGRGRMVAMFQGADCWSVFAMRVAHLMVWRFMGASCGDGKRGNFVYCIWGKF